MKRLKYIASATDDIVVKTVFGNTLTFLASENYELDIENDDEANSLLVNQVFQDITES